MIDNDNKKVYFNNAKSNTMKYYKPAANSYT